MLAIADQRSRTLHAGAEMRPRRWYTDEHAPPARAARMTSELWRYRTLAQRRTNNAAPMLERRCSYRSYAFTVNPIILFFFKVQPHP
jgi:hypothetical protein